MKKLVLMVALIATVAFATYCVINDAVTGDGYNWQTRQEYRWNVAEGKR